MISSFEQTPDRYLDEVNEDSEDEELLTEGELSSEEDDTLGEEDAILEWIRSFPQIAQSKVILSKDWLYDEFISRALLCVGAEIYETNEPLRDDVSDYQHWKKMAEWVSYQSKNVSDKEARLLILVRLLCRAVAHKCNKRGQYINRIMNLDKDVQRVLMQIIEREGARELNDSNDCNSASNGAHNESDETYLDDLDIENDNESLLDDDEKDTIQPSANKENIQNNHTPSSQADQSFLSPLATMQSCIKSNSTPRYKGSLTKRAIFTPLSPQNQNMKLVEKLEKETVSLQLKNNNLSKELELMRKQEQTLLTKLNKIEAEHRADRLGVEASGLVRINELKDEYTQKISLLEKEVCECNATIADTTLAKEELAILRDEVDVLRHSNGKLIQTEEQLTRLKLKMEQMGEVTDALRREEKAHSDAVSKCLEIENELALLQPIRRQLDEYKSRAADAEVKLIEYEDDVQNLKNTSEKLNKINKDLEARFVRQQQETEDLRRQIKQDGQYIQNNCNALGEGMTELNPVLKEELLRLRSENKRLEAFAAKRNKDSVQKMEEHVEDSDRLATKFKEQYLSTKSSLTETKKKLGESLQREVVLKQKLSDSEESVKALNLTLKEERKSHQKALIETLRAQQAAKRTLMDKCREEKASLEKEWETKFGEQHKMAEKEISRLKEVFKQKEESLVQSIAELRKESGSVLLKHKKESSTKIDKLVIDHKAEVDELTKIHTEERNKLIKRNTLMVEEEISKANTRIEDTQKAYDERVHKLSQELQKCQQLYKVNGEKAMSKIHSYRQKIRIAQAKELGMSRESDLMQEKYKKLEKEKVRLLDENERYRRQLGSRFGADSTFRNQYEELQREYTSILEENRSLRKYANTKITCIQSDSESAQTTSHDHLDIETSITYDTGPKVNSSVSQLRSEYEERIAEIIDEKRELIMKNSATRTDVQKAEIRAHELEVLVQKLESEKTSLQLQLEREKSLHSDQFSPLPTGKRLASKISPTALACKAHEMWKASKISKMTSPSKSTEEETIDEGLNYGTNTSPSKFSILPRVDAASPEFKRSVKNFKQKLHLSLKKEKRPSTSPITNLSPKSAPKLQPSVKKEEKTSTDSKNVLNSSKNLQQMKLSSNEGNHSTKDQKSITGHSPKNAQLSLMNHTRPSKNSETEDVNTQECTQS